MQMITTSINVDRYDKFHLIKNRMKNFQLSFVTFKSCFLNNFFNIKFSFRLQLLTENRKRFREKKRLIINFIFVLLFWFDFSLLKMIKTLAIQYK